MSESIEKCLAFADSDDCEVGDAVDPIVDELSLVANSVEDSKGIVDDVVNELFFVIEL